MGRYRHVCTSSLPVAIPPCYKKHKVPGSDSITARDTHDGTTPVQQALLYKHSQVRMCALYFDLLIMVYLYLLTKNTLKLWKPSEWPRSQKYILDPRGAIQRQIVDPNTNLLCFLLLCSINRI